ncbi:RCC1 domain-containing protein 1 isoform X1 [Drosophila novamexicana]|uniref:RCC1 domain-containing protein 1 isoform X1 n=1 Tax=Drosophila novamexicana TaxID=47314 RepID=UPI0011E5D9E6|nr:RCC1 domain-containing protein 1 isoform X1 [Drosophila novamexicana]XP_030559617.1 RCC1 domain-containing protein 1 isoform X1 [Drosophila novamexicana]
MRQLLFTGFNAFGQHNGSNTDRISGRVTALTEISVPGDGAGNAIIALSWRYTAYAVGTKLWLRGLFDLVPGECLEVEAPASIKALAACDSHCLVLLQNGELYKLQAKLKATLQHIKLETIPTTSAATKRTIFGTSKLARDASNDVTHIACGTHINVAISANNAVYSIPSCLHQFPQRQWRVQQLECGHEHALLLNGNGDVYSWGNGLRGQLGHETLAVVETPLLLEALAGIKITHIAAGGWHSVAISAFGDLYTWGLNCKGQQGMRVMKPDGLLKEPTVYPLPQLHDLPDCCGEENVVCAPLRVFAGSRHTLLLRSCGRLWASGWCAHGQLGKQPTTLEYLDIFQAVRDTPKGNNYTVFCGPWSSLIALLELFKNFVVNSLVSFICFEIVTALR